ncbi:MAG: type II toxin-antitoxin system Phd/YefM family antitoxin [Candidatus Dormibacteria bacterium]
MRISATEASRKFSELLTRVASGETVEVARHGQIVAVVVPPGRALLPGVALLELLGSLPRLDEGFATDVARLSEVATRPGEPWPS